MKRIKSKENKNTGATILVVCGVIAIALMVGCVFFPDEIFGMLLNK